MSSIERQDDGTHRVVVTAEVTVSPDKSAPAEVIYNPKLIQLELSGFDDMNREMKAGVYKMLAQHFMDLAVMHATLAPPPAEAEVILVPPDHRD